MPFEMYVHTIHEDFTFIITSKIPTISEQYCIIFLDQQYVISRSDLISSGKSFIFSLPLEYNNTSMVVAK